ncbi:Conserved hypothetical protein [Candidatus Phytoplasma australiense]|uniref:Uncharacterized protein n=2 Tax=Phytoplasma australiense TaxID=59748 RepID=B1VAJ7_PHYAS|nr:hypothetical protein [Candidatus Phytoplasma australiense]AGL90368.1 hypothetical protein SLY_0448 [Strawberry lethal yellows phytoplasma (CPA) str. NZSb11]CAM11970.1 Conserved hypothetical protein [Candidatus Phytoplasma australiense]
MQFLSSLWDIVRQFNFFITYISGFVSGLVFAFFIYFFLALRRIEKDFAKGRPAKKDVNRDTIIELIDAKGKDFKAKIKKDKDNFGNLLLASLKELTLEIPKHFYPDSKYPYLELTIEESLILMLYINKRIDNIFQNKILRIFRKMTLKRIFVIRGAIVKKNIVQKYQKTKKVVNTFGNVKNFLNPFHWIKKLVFDKPLELIFIQIGVSLISITGEEFYKIYSKKIFEPENDVEQDLKKVLESLSDDTN